MIATKSSGLPAQRCFGRAERSPQGATQQVKETIKRGAAMTPNQSDEIFVGTLSIEKRVRLMDHYRIHEPQSVEKYIEEASVPLLLDGLMEMGRQIPRYFGTCRAELEILESPENGKRRLGISIRSGLPVREHVQTMIKLIREVYQPLFQSMGNSIVIL